MRLFILALLSLSCLTACATNGNNATAPDLDQPSAGNHLSQQNSQNATQSAATMMSPLTP